MDLNRTTQIALLASLLIATARSQLGLSFVRWPEPIVAPVGDDVVFECSLNVPAESVRWRHGNTWLKHERPPRPSPTSRHVVKFTDEKQEGDYQCVAWFGASALASTPAKLTLAELHPFVYQPHRELTVTPGNTVAISCPPPVSRPPAIIQYLHNGNLMSGSSTILPTTGTLLLTNVTSKDSGVYTCTATNYITGMIINSPLKVTVKVEDSDEFSPPRFLYQQQTKYVIQAGQNVSLECSGVGRPPPNVTWRRVNGVLPKERADLVPGALRITNLQEGDRGDFICELNNGVPPMAAQLISLEVQLPPKVVKGPTGVVVEEENDTELSCDATGVPAPNITWLLNGDSLHNDSHFTPIGGKLYIKRIQKKHAGIYQCFASNPVGVHYGAAIIQVSPIQVTAGDLPPYPQEIEEMDFEDMSGREEGSPGRGHKKDHTRKGKGRRKDKKHKTNVMIPPTRPNITRLSNRSVMVRWSVPQGPSLPIQFFKVQYQDLDSSGKSGRWMTSNEDIQPHIRSYEVDGLTTGHHYRFRIAAVYSNNDNKLGRTSTKFFLHRVPANDKTPFFPPNLTHAEGVTTTSVRIHWEYLNSVLAPVDGFYVYYRSTSNAGDYIKATVEGQSARSFLITHLQPDTSYDIKMQSFTVSAASDFSAIITAKTLREANATVAPPPEVIGVVGLGEKPSQGQLYLVLGAVIAGLTLLFTLGVAICICYRRSSLQHHHGSESCDKGGGVEPGLTIQQLEPVGMNGFSHMGKGRGVVNGYIARPMNITNNPLADSDQDKNVMELSYMTSHNNNCSSGGGTGGGRSETEDERGGWRPPRLSRTTENYV